MIKTSIAMKTPSEDLFELIQTLTKTEKRFFQQFANRHTIGEKNIYYRLFEIISSQTVYDETAIKASLGNEPAAQKAVKNLAVVKKQLYEQLLLALHQYHQVHSVIEKVKRTLHTVHILLEKRLFSQAEKRLKTIENTILTYDLKELLIEFYDIKHRLLAHQSYKNTTLEDLKNYHETVVNATDKLQNLSKLRQVSYTIQALHYKKVSVEDFEQQADFWAILKQEQPTSRRAEMERLRGLATYHFMTNEPQAAYSANVQLIAHMETHPHLIELYPATYLSVFNNYLIDNLQLKKYDALEKGFLKLDRLLSDLPFRRIPDLAMRTARQRFLLELNWIIATADFAKSHLLIPKLQEFLKKHKTAILPQHQITFFYLLAYCHFELQNYSAALTELNKILAFREKLVAEIVEFAHLLNLLTHFELGHSDLLESLLSSTPRWLRKRRPLYQTEIALFGHFKKLLYAIDEKEKRQFWQIFKMEITALKTDKRERRVFNYFDLLAWTNRKI